MKFLPTPEQLDAALVVGAHFNGIDEAQELSTLVGDPTVIKIYNAAMMGINNGYPPQVHWRQTILLAMRIGWYLREQVGEQDQVFKGINEAEIEGMLREIRKERAA